MRLTFAILVALLALFLAVGFRSFTADWHRWRRPSYGRDLIDFFLVLGFVTIWLSRARMTDRLKVLTDELRKLKEQL